MSSLTANEFGHPLTDLFYACCAKTLNQLTPLPTKSATSKASVLQSRIWLETSAILHHSRLKKHPVFYFIIFFCYSGIERMLMRWHGLHVDTCCKVLNLRFGSLHIFRTLEVSIRSFWNQPNQTVFTYLYISHLPLNQVYVHCSLCTSVTTRDTNIRFQRHCTALCVAFIHGVADTKDSTLQNYLINHL